MARPDIEGDDFRVHITAKHVEMTPPIKQYLQEKVDRMERITEHVIDVHIRLDIIRKVNHIVDIVVRFSHFTIKVEAITDDMYASIDRAFEKLYRKMRRWKEKIQDHQAKGIPVVEMAVNVLEKPSNLQYPDPVEDRGSPEFIANTAEEEVEKFNEEIEQESQEELMEEFGLPKIVRTKKRVLKTLTLDEAIMKMELSSDHFMLYRGEEDQKLKVIYRRRDGSYGIILPAS